LVELENNAGIKIVDNSSLQFYVNSLIKSYENCTHIAEWPIDGKVFSHTGIGQQLVSIKTPHIPKISAIALEPYYFKKSWMPAIKGKRILIVHPFVTTFKKQLEHITSLFPDQESWFEDCKLEFISPPFTLAGNHQTADWQSHYTTFINSIREFKDFDIAFVAAGGYGMLISNYIYTELNKSVIYIGGALQLFFGVIGRRWFENKEIMKLVNDNWVRPQKEDKPQNCLKVENGCYW
jgi:hypothetical protein